MIRYATKTDIGLKRKRNEDYFLVVDQNSKNYPVEDLGLLFVVADGMGGHPAGNVASKIACETLCRTYYVTSAMERKLIRFSSFFSTDPLIKRLEAGFLKAQEAICNYECSHGSCKGLGTTLSALILRNRHYYICHIGDSRIYRLRNGELSLLTVDHTFVQDLVDMGEMSQKEAEKSPMRHVLMQALGPGIEKVYKKAGGVKRGDTFLLCTDGLHDLLNDSEIKEILVLDEDIEKRCKRLVEEALKRGGKDNITVIIVEKL